MKEKKNRYRIRRGPQLTELNSIPLFHYIHYLIFNDFACTQVRILNSLLVLRFSDTFCQNQMCFCAKSAQCTAITIASSSASLTSSTGILNSRSFFMFLLLKRFFVVVLIRLLFLLFFNLVTCYSSATFLIFNFCFCNSFVRSFYYIWRKNIYLPFQLFDVRWSSSLNLNQMKIPAHCDRITHCALCTFAHLNQSNPIKYKTKHTHWINEKEQVKKMKKKRAQFSLKRFIKQNLICVPHILHFKPIISSDLLYRVISNHSFYSMFI